MWSPSTFLPLLTPPLPDSILLMNYLTQLSAHLNPPNTVIDLRSAPLKDTTHGRETEEEEEGGNKRGDDEFETVFAKGWITRLIVAGSTMMAMLYAEYDSLLDASMEVEDQDEITKAVEGKMETIEVLISEASNLLVALSGPSGAGSSTKTFLLPFVVTRATPTTDSISITLRDTTLLSNSTGFRTWGSSPLLAQLIGSSPLHYFPSSLSSGHTSVTALELGSGTGLVGMMIKEVMEKLNRNATIVLSDFEDAVLSNLDYNLALNSSSSPASTRVEIRKLDWLEIHSRPLTGSTKLDETDQFDYIFAADVIYEPLHVSWIYSTVTALLRLPVNGQPQPRFHLVLPIRSTHSLETTTFETKFDPHRLIDITSTDQKRGHRLVTKRNRTFWARDGFGAGGSEMRQYLVYEIGWECCVGCGTA